MSGSERTLAVTGEELRGARVALGKMWGERLNCNALGHCLRLRGSDVGKLVSDMEHGRRPISGPISVCIELWLAGAPKPRI